MGRGNSVGDALLQGDGNPWHLRHKTKESNSPHPKQEARQGLALTFIIFNCAP